jgi:uncharacterized membrane protein YdjX (TVP38/TMEM64 family)
VASAVNRTKLVVGIVAVAAAIVAIRLLPVGEWLTSFQAWVKGFGVWGVVLYALVYAACTVAFVPGSILTLGAGAIFGLAQGFAAVLLGASLGAILSFFLARGVLRDRIAAVTARNPRFAALDRAIAKEGGKIVFLVRLAPIFPFNLVNYAFGLTGVRPAAYALATVTGIVPGTLAYVYLGYAGATAAGGSADSAKLLVNVGGAIAALIVTIVVARIATKAIREAGV